MRRRCVVLAVITLSLGLPVAFGGTITFSELGLTQGQNLTNQLASLGVIVDVSNGSAIVGDTTQFTAPAGSSIDGNVAVLPFSQGSTAHLNVRFVDPTDPSVFITADGATIAFDLWDTNPIPSPRVTVNAYDSGDVFLGKYDLTTEWVNGAGGFSGSVARLEFVDNGGDGLGDHCCFLSGKDSSPSLLQPLRH